MADRTNPFSALYVSIINPQSGNSYEEIIWPVPNLFLMKTLRSK
jgi:hypothetical protein